MEYIRSNFNNRTAALCIDYPAPFPGMAGLYEFIFNVSRFEYFGMLFSDSCTRK